MMWLWCLLLIGGIAALRQRQLDRPTLPIYAKDFDGEILRIGACHALVRRAAATPRATVVCVPGFLEEVWYFDGLYEDADLDCIYLNNADYHVTTVAPEARAQAVDWDRPLPYAVGTISHDAAVLNQVLTHLVRSGPIRLHGHSRGGAVVLEAALQSPELHRRLEIEYLLEAPVLPQGDTPEPCLGCDGSGSLAATGPVSTASAPAHEATGAAGVRSAPWPEAGIGFPAVVQRQAGPDGRHQCAGHPVVDAFPNDGRLRGVPRCADVDTRGRPGSDPESQPHGTQCSSDGGTGTRGGGSGDLPYAGSGRSYGNPARWCCGCRCRP